MEQPYAAWRAEFEVELLRRTRLTWADACGDEGPLQNYYASKDSPADAVQHYIEKYDLIDFTKSPSNGYY